MGWVECSESHVKLSFHWISGQGQPFLLCTSLTLLYLVSKEHDWPAHRSGRKGSVGVKSVLGERGSCSWLGRRLFTNCITKCPSSSSWNNLPSKGFWFGEQWLALTDYHMGPVTTMILVAFASILSPNIRGWIHNTGLSRGRVENIVSQVNDLRGSRGTFSSKISPTEGLYGWIPTMSTKFFSVWKALGTLYSFIKTLKMILRKKGSLF